jgi:hypothetical protein
MWKRLISTLTAFPLAGLLMGGCNGLPSDGQPTPVTLVVVNAGQSPVRIGVNRVRITAGVQPATQPAAILTDLSNPLGPGESAPLEIPLAPASGRRISYSRAGGAKL